MFYIFYVICMNVCVYVCIIIYFSINVNYLIIGVSETLKIICTKYKKTSSNTDTCRERGIIHNPLF